MRGFLSSMYSATGKNKNKFEIVLKEVQGTFILHIFPFNSLRQDKLKARITFLCQSVLY